jgi:hypothetical protein
MFSVLPIQGESRKDVAFFHKSGVAFPRSGSGSYPESFKRRKFKTTHDNNFKDKM